MNADAIASDGHHDISDINNIAPDLGHGASNINVVASDIHRNALKSHRDTDSQNLTVSTPRTLAITE